MAKINVKWFGPQFTARTNAALFAGLKKGVSFARGKIVLEISTSARANVPKKNRGARNPKKGAKPPMQFARSKPGEPPRRDTGKLAQSIFGSQSKALMMGRVGTTLKYGAFLEVGTRPYPISARRKKSLAFGFKGKWVFPRSVKHPGIAKRPYLLSTVRKNRVQINSIIISTARARMRV